MTYKDYKSKLQPRLIQDKWSIQGTVPVLGRIRKQFTNLDLAQFESQKLINQVENQLAQGSVRTTLLSPSQEADASQALQVLTTSPNFQGSGLLSLLDVVRYADQRLTHTDFQADLDTATRNYIQDLADRGRVGTYLKQIKRRCNKLISYLGEEILIKDITKPMVKAWIRGAKGDLSPFTGKDVSKTTRTGELTFLKGLFNFALSNDWISESPCEGVKGYGREKGEIQALSLEKAQEFLDIAREVSDEAFCYFTLSLFAGLRPEELRPADGEAQVCWDHFTWRDEESTLEISYQVGKVTSRRVIVLPDNLVRHIKPLAQDSGPIIKSSYAVWRSIKDYIRARAGYQVYGGHYKHIDPDLSKVSNDTSRPKYVRDVLRHSAITYKLELEQNKDAVAMWAGNSPAVIDQHYRALVKGTKKLSPRKYATAYFNL